MKKVNKKVETVEHDNDVFSIFSENEILSLQAMMQVRGGDPDGGDPIIIIPPKH